MVFHKIRSLSMTELFVREIKRMILMGELKIGDRLPPERELAQKMGLKLTVVNSGIAQLQQKLFEGVEVETSEEEEAAEGEGE